MSSTTVEVILITGLVLGIVVAMFGAIYAWEKWVVGSRAEKRIDDFFDRVSDKFFR